MIIINDIKVNKKNGVRKASTIFNTNKITNEINIKIVGRILSNTNKKERLTICQRPVSG